MKKSLIILFFLFSTPILIAQNLTFEETVKYIHDKLIEFDSDGRYDKEGRFKAMKNGDLQFDWMGNFKINLFNLNDNKRFDNKIPGWIEVSHPALDENVLIPSINFYSDGKAIAALYFRNSTTVSDMERLCKALIHLRSLCSKESDPFGN